MYQITASCGAKISYLVFDSGDFMAVGLTRCCGASGKGNSESSTGVVCRNCYQEVPAAYGGVNAVSIEQANRDANCPVPEDCARHTLWQIQMELEREGLVEA